MKKHILSALLILALLGMAWSACASEAFDYSVFESYEAEYPDAYTFEIDESDSLWSITSCLFGNEGNLMMIIRLNGDLDGTSVYPRVVIGRLGVDLSDINIEKVQFLIDDTVCTIEGEEWFQESNNNILLYGENGEALLEALASADGFSVRMTADGTDYNDTFTADTAFMPGLYADFLFIVDEAVRQNAIGKLPGTSVQLALLEIYQPITIQ